MPHAAAAALDADARYLRQLHYCGPHWMLAAASFVGAGTYAVGGSAAAATAAGCILGSGGAVVIFVSRSSTLDGLLCLSYAPAVAIPSGPCGITVVAAHLFVGIRPRTLSR